MPAVDPLEPEPNSHPLTPSWASLEAGVKELCSPVNCEGAIGTGPSPFFAFRTWWLVPGMGLFAANFPVLWPPGEDCVAVCLPNFYNSYACRGFERCSCGFYGLSSFADAVAMSRQMISDWAGNGLLFCMGASLHGGKVVVAQKGLRSVKARPLALLDVAGYREALQGVGPPSLWSRLPASLQECARDYRIPLLGASALASYALEFGDSPQE